MANMMKFDLIKLGREVLVIYLIFIGAYIAISIIVYQAKYSAAKRRVNAYNDELEMIEEIAEDDAKNNAHSRRADD